MGPSEIIFDVTAKMYLNRDKRIITYLPCFTDRWLGGKRPRPRHPIDRDAGA
jgi:hypothetical protein